MTIKGNWPSASGDPIPTWTIVNLLMKHFESWLTIVNNFYHHYSLLPIINKQLTIVNHKIAIIDPFSSIQHLTQPSHHHFTGLPLFRPASRLSPSTPHWGVVAPVHRGEPAPLVREGLRGEWHVKPSNPTHRIGKSPSSTWFWKKLVVQWSLCWITRGEPNKAKKNLRSWPFRSPKGAGPHQVPQNGHSTPGPRMHQDAPGTAWSEIFFESCCTSKTCSTWEGLRVPWAPEVSSESSTRTYKQIISNWTANILHSFIYLIDLQEQVIDL